jgi:hypothetical protein
MRGAEMGLSRTEAADVNVLEAWEATKLKENMP